MWYLRAEQKYPRKTVLGGLQTLLEEEWFSHQIAETFNGLGRPELVWSCCWRRQVTPLEHKQGAGNQQLAVWACSGNSGPSRQEKACRVCRPWGRPRGAWLCKSLVSPWRDGQIKAARLQRNWGPGLWRELEIAGSCIPPAAPLRRPLSRALTIVLTWENSVVHHTAQSDT